MGSNTVIKLQTLLNECAWFFRLLILSIGTNMKWKMIVKSMNWILSIVIK